VEQAHERKEDGCSEHKAEHLTMKHACKGSAEPFL
jgi:hypothetical protein